MSGISSITYERHVNDGQYAGRRVTVTFNLTDGDNDVATAERETKASVHRMLGLEAPATGPILRPEQTVPKEEPAIEKPKRGRPKKEGTADPLLDTGAPGAMSQDASKEAGVSDPLADLGPGAPAAPAASGAPAQTNADPLAELDAAPVGIDLTKNDLNKAMSAAMQRLKGAPGAVEAIWGILLDPRFNPAGITQGPGASTKIIDGVPAALRGAFVNAIGKLGA